jgi:hypothetical protein
MLLNRPGFGNYLYRRTTNSFWDTQTSGLTYSAGGSGKTTAEMKNQSTFESAGWDFSTPVWVMRDGYQYPWLAWERKPVEIEIVSVDEKQRVGRDVFRYLCTSALENTRSQSFSNVIAELSGAPENVTVLDGIVTCSYIGAHRKVFSTDTFEIEVDRSVLIDPVEIVWNVTYETTDGGQSQHTYMSNFDFGISGISGDITGEGNVDIEDLGMLLRQWLWEGEPGEIEEDLTGDGKVDFSDVAKLGEHWQG